MDELAICSGFWIEGRACALDDMLLGYLSDPNELAD